MPATHDDLAKVLMTARKSGSVLSHVVQDYYNNKKEQSAINHVEDAVLAVQLAATIVGTVPSPVTIAVGNTMGATRTCW
jgi:hypothetical protein